MNSAELRVLFLDYVGPETFRRFAQALRRFANYDPSSIRLRFWQEQLWQEYRNRYPSATLEIEEISTALLWCDVHDRPLANLPSVNMSDVRKTPELHSYYSERCPFGFGFWSISCLNCVQELTDWIAKHPDDCRVLRRQTTLQEYIGNCPCHDDPKFKRAMKNAELAIEGAINDGDEIWEWDAGDGITGLAIVRDGKMKTSWRAPIEW